MSSKLKEQTMLLSPVTAWKLSEIKDWKKFGAKLRVPQQMLQDIEKKHPKNVQCALEEVIRYGIELYKDATINKMIEILFEMKENELAMKLLNDQEPYAIIPSRPDELVVKREDDIIKSLTYLQKEFTYLVTELQRALQKVADFVQLKRFIKEYLRESFSPKKDPTCIDSLFDALREHYCYLNFEILEVTAIEFAYQYADRLMYHVITDYNRDLNEFLESTHLKAFKDAVEKTAQEVEIYQLTTGQCNVVLRLEGSWMKARISCLWVLLKHIFRDKVSLFTRLKIEGGSVIVRFVVPSSIMVTLISFASKKLEDLAYLGILSIQVGHIILSSPLSHNVEFSLRLSLHFAITGKHNPSLIECLLQLGADPNCKDPINTPLIVAAMYDNIEAMSLLIKYEADVHMFNSMQISAIHLAKSVSGVKLLLDAGVSPDHHEPITKFTPLMSVAAANNREMVDFLLKNGADIDFQEADGYSALMQACMTGSDRSVEALLEAGANPNLKTRENPAMKTRKGTTALYIACRRRNEKIVNLLLRFKADPNIALDDDGTTPLIVACNFSYYNIVRLLLDSNADVNTKVEGAIRKITALHIAAYDNDTELISLLLDAKADVNVCDANNVTPLHLVCLHENEEALQKLLQAGANPNICSVGRVSPLLTAVQQTKNVRIIQKLLVAGADPNISTETNKTTPLHVACDCTCENILQLLLSHKAEPDVLDSDGHTPLCVATYRGNFNIVKLLLKAGASTELENDERCWTPIFFAAAQIDDQVNILKLLIENGAVLTKKDKLGKTVLDIATQLGNTKAKEFLSQAQNQVGKTTKSSLHAKTDSDSNTLLNITTYINTFLKQKFSYDFIETIEHNTKSIKKLLDQVY